MGTTVTAQLVGNLYNIGLNGADPSTVLSGFSAEGFVVNLENAIGGYLGQSAAAQTVVPHTQGMMNLIHSTRLTGGDPLLATWEHSDATNATAFAADLQIAHDDRTYVDNAPAINASSSRKAKSQSVYNSC